MDRYDRIIEDIQKRTQFDRLSWRVVKPSSFARILMNPERVLRAYQSEYSLGGKTYELAFVKKKTDVHDDYGNVVADGYGCELYILGEDGEIVVPLYEGVVERDDLIRLGALIEGNNDRAKEFFAAFDASEVA